MAYASLYEVRAFTLREVTVPVLPAGSDPLRILHLSDAHMTPSQHRKREWLRRLAELEPDLVVNTGDNLAHMDALPSVLEAYGDLLDLPGVFVFGSNDYYSPTRKNPALLPLGGTGTSGGRNEWWRTRAKRPPVRADAARLHRARLGRPTNTHASLTSPDGGSRSSASTTRTSGTTSSTTSRPTLRRTSRSGWPTRPTCGCSTAGTRSGTR